MTGNMHYTNIYTGTHTHTHAHTDIVIHSSVFGMQMSQALPDQGPDLGFT